MKKIVDDERRIIQICDMYYNQEKTQSEIAKELQISRPTVAKMIAVAKECGIVKIMISSVSGRNYFDLERKLEEKYQLKEVIIVDTKEDEQEQKDELGKAAAMYLSRIMREGDVIGVSMGSTLGHIAKFVDQKLPYKNVTFLPILGGVGQTKNDLHANFLAESLAKAYGVDCLYFHAPAVVSRVQTKTELMKETSIQTVLNHIRKMNIVLLAIGNLEYTSTMLKAGYYSNEVLDRHKKQGAVGDICMKFYDADGNMEDFEINQNVISTKFSELKEKPYTITLFTGVRKVRAVYAALKGKLTNTIILDYATAKALFSMEDGDLP